MQRLIVFTDDDEVEVTAMAVVNNKVVEKRRWRLVGNGILLSVDIEDANRMNFEKLIKPSTNLERQIKREIEAFARQYHIPSREVKKILRLLHLPKEFYDRHLIDIIRANYEATGGDKILPLDNVFDLFYALQPRDSISIPISDVEAVRIEKNYIYRPLSAWRVKDQVFLVLGLSFQPPGTLNSRYLEEIPLKIRGDPLFLRILRWLEGKSKAEGILNKDEKLGDATPSGPAKVIRKMLVCTFSIEVKGENG